MKTQIKKTHPDKRQHDQRTPNQCKEGTDVIHNEQLPGLLHAPIQVFNQVIIGGPILRVRSKVEREG
jgi:hypothetical protein